jgi:hypothetical protein
MTEIQVCFIRPQWRSPYFIWRQIYKYTEQNKFSNLWYLIKYDNITKYKKVVSKFFMNVIIN